MSEPKPSSAAAPQLLVKESVTDGTPPDILARYESLPQVVQEADFGPYDHDVVVIDTETTGVSPKKDELTQIAAARLERGQITDWYVTFVNPGMPIPDEISHLTHIYDADVADAPSPEEALEGLVAFAGDAKMVAHNAEFDRTFTTKHPAGYPLLENAGGMDHAAAVRRIRGPCVPGARGSRAGATRRRRQFRAGAFLPAGSAARTHAEGAARCQAGRG